jgi:non-specific serine/threonine protein kinase
LAGALGLSTLQRDALFRSAARPGQPRAPRAAAAETARTQHDVPTPPTRLLGRAHELDQARRQLIENGVRLLTLTGPPGVGKTRFAIETASVLAENFPDGVAFVALASLAAPDLLADTLVRALGAGLGGDARPLETLVAYLSDKRFLLVLDNFEQLLAAAPILTDLLMGCPLLTLLVTSRGIIHVRGERALTIAPLPVPDGASSLSVVVESPAVSLFVASAKAVRPEFELTPENMADVIEICQRLDGLPLALELAAARIRLLPPRALLARLERRLPMLTGGASDLPERHKTLRAALAWSYELLSAQQRVVFRRLSVFAGGATLDAAAAICTEADADDPDLLDLLASLADHGLVLAPEDSASGDPRIGMLQIVREFGHEQLMSTGELTAVQRAHADYFLSLAKSANAGVLGVRSAEWMSRLDTEVDNMRGALAWCREHVDEALDLGLRLCGGLAWYWLLRGRLREGRAWCDAFLGTGDAQADTLSRGLALHTAGMLAWAQRDIGTAAAYAEAEVATFQASGHQQLLGPALALLSRVRVYQGDPDAALALIAQSRDLIPRTGEEDAGIRQARLGYFEGRALTAKGDLQAARSCYELNLRIIERIGDHRLRSVLCAALGDLAVATGDDASADELFERSLPGLLSERTTSQWDLALLLVNMGFSALRNARLDDAENLLNDALHNWLDQGLRAGIGLALRGLGGVAAARGEEERAGMLFGASTIWLTDSDPFLAEARGVAASAERCLVDTQALVDPVAFRAGWSTGVSLTEPVSINLALQSSTVRG